MPQQRSNKSQTPINSDPFNLIPDLATMSDTLGVVVVVANQTEGDSVATARASAGWPVSDTRPLYVFDTSLNALMVKNSSGWIGVGERVRQMHFKATAFAVAGGSVLWDMGPLVVQAGDTINGGFASQNATSGTITINETGYYSIGGVCMPDGSPGNAMLSLIKAGGEVLYETSTTGYSWPLCPAIPRRKLVAGDTILFRTTTVTSRNWTSDIWIYKIGN